MDGFGMGWGWLDSVKAVLPPRNLVKHHGLRVEVRVVQPLLLLRVAAGRQCFLSFAFPAWISLKVKADGLPVIVRWEQIRAVR